MSYGNKIRELTIDLSKKAGVGHIGSSLSIADIVGTVYEHFIDMTPGNDNTRNRFVLSKGHAALAQYAALYIKGFITREDLDSYCADNSQFGVHPKHFIDHIDFSSGSLGQGVTFATGAALAAKMQNSPRRVFCVMSDAELNEGCVWEAFMFAATHKLDNLVLILDNNGQQALGFTQDVIKIPDIVSTMKSLGWDTHTIDGHSEQEIKHTIESLPSTSGKPCFINALTVSGKGISYMEKTIKWHYKSMNDAEYAQAQKELHA